MSINALSRGACVAAVLFTLVAGASLPAHATTFSLGTLSGSASFDVGNAGLSGLFSDGYTFAVAAGTSLVFSSRLETPPSNRFWIPDLSAMLFVGGDDFIKGTTERSYFADVFPVDSVSFAPLTLAAGHYRLVVSGHATSAFEGPTSNYTGSLQFESIAAPVPEPDTLALMLAGLAGLGVWARRRAAH